MSDTPRTDSQPWIFQYPEYHETAKRYVDADFARQLERENARLRWKYAELGLYVDADYARLRSELEAKMEDGYSPRLPNASDEPRPLGAVGSGRLLGGRGK